MKMVTTREAKPSYTTTAAAARTAGRVRLERSLASHAREAQKSSGGKKDTVLYSYY